MKPLARRFTPIGIDVGARAIKAVQLLRVGQTWRLHAAVNMPLPSPDHPLDAQTARQLFEVLIRNDFKGREVVLAAPNRELEVDVMELPPRTSGAPIEQIAQMEIARSAKLENDPFEMQLWELPAAARGASAASMMVMALRHKHINAQIEPLDAEGINVVAIDARCWALVRACSGYQVADAMHVVVDIGWSSTLLLLVRNGTVIYRRLLTQCGIATVYRTLQNDFGLNEQQGRYVLNTIGVAELSDDESQIAQAPRIRSIVKRYFDAITVEIDAAIHYAQHRYGNSASWQVFIAGGGAKIAGAVETLEKRLGFTSRVLLPATVVEVPADLNDRGADPALVTALGLAMHGACQSQVINLIPAPRRQKQQRLSRTKKWLTAGTAYAALLVGLCTATRLTFHPASSASAEELRLTNQHIVQLNAKIGETRKLLSAADALHQTAVSISDQPDWSILLNLLGSATVDQIALREVQLTPLAGKPQSYQLLLRGVGTSQAEVSQFILRLQRLGILSDVTLARTSREPFLKSTVISFEVSANINGASEAK